MSSGYARQVRERVFDAKDGTVFASSDFAEISVPSTMRKIFSRLVREGTLERIHDGVFHKPKFSKLLGGYVSADPEAIAKALARNYHWAIAPGGNTALKRLGLPAQETETEVWTYISDGPYRTYEWKDLKIEFRHRTNEEVTGPTYLTNLVIQALKTIGKLKMNQKVIETLSANIRDSEKSSLLREAEEAAESLDWVYDVIRQICGDKEVR